jgi:hypothetical protein
MRKLKTASVAAGTLLLGAGLVTSALSGGPASAATSFGSPVVLPSPPGQNLGEPGIAVAADGAIYIDAPPGIDVASDLFKSTDGGSTWALTPAGLRANLPGGGDVNIAVDPGAPQTIYMTDLWLGSATVSVSHDGAATWMSNPFQGVPVQDRRWIATPGGGIAYHVTHQIPSGLIVSKSIDGGITYPRHTVAATPADQTGCVCPPGNLIAEGGSVLSGGNVGVIYSTSTGGVNFAHSSDGGLTFTQATVRPSDSTDDTGRSFPVVANAGNNQLFAVWLEVDPNGSAWSRVGFSKSSDWGATWSAPAYLVSSLAGQGGSVYPWVDAKGSKVAVSLYHAATNGAPDSIASGAAWFETYLESTDGGTTFSAPTVADPTAVKTGPICTQGTGCSGNRELLDFQSAAIDGAGKADLAYTHSIDNVSKTELRFVHEV